VATDTHRAIEAVWRIEAPRLIAALTRLVRDLGAAGELAQDALVAALEQWPAQGVPRNPGAWLTTTAKRRAIDQIRREETYRRKVEQVGRELEESTPDIGAPTGTGRWAGRSGTTSRAWKAADALTCRGEPCRPGAAPYGRAVTAHGP
jgi:DNA-directed RNA polymerase specialized sigma24 family protein